jgi:DNA polymerase/3'-5' exonuclease PolX
MNDVLKILKNYPKKITLDNYKELEEIEGIGKGTIERIVEILKNGKLKELENYTNINSEKMKSINDLESVVGIGSVLALELYNKGIKSVKELKKMIKEKKIEVNDKILLGLKYYGKFEGKIPRKEIDKIYIIFKSIITNINKNLKKNEKYVFDFCGSYRREKEFCNDIDILVSKHGTLDKNFNYLEKIVNLLKEPFTKNNNQPLLVDDITNKNYHTKYMGFIKYKDKNNRRIDIRFVPFESYYSALVYFTGSMELNRKMRSIAKKKNLKLSEYGLFKKNGDKIEIKSEEDVFDALDIAFLEPNER